MDAPVYFPLLRAKPGEIEALGRLSPLAKRLTLPILDLPKLPSPNDSLTNFACARFCDTKQSWGTAFEIGIDYSRFEPERFVEAGENLLPRLFHYARQLGLKAVPVTGSPSARGPEQHYIEGIAEVLRNSDAGVLIRLDRDEFGAISSLQRTLETMITLLSAAPDKVDVYFDAGSLSEDDVALEDSALMASLDEAIAFASSAGFRRVIVGGSSHPDPMSRKLSQPVFRGRTNEWALWQSILARRSRTAVLYGDYGVVHPRQTEPDGPVKPPSRVRLINEHEYVIHRGSRTAIRDVARVALEDDAYRMMRDSWGRQETARCARGSGDPGGPTTWIARDTNSHIEHIAHEVHRELARRDLVPALRAEAIAEPWFQTELLR